MQQNSLSFLKIASAWEQKGFYNEADLFTKLATKIESKNSYIENAEFLSKYFILSGDKAFGTFIAKYALSKFSKPNRFASSSPCNDSALAVLKKLSRFNDSTLLKFAQYKFTTTGEDWWANRILNIKYPGAKAIGKSNPDQYYQMFSDVVNNLEKYKNDPAIKGQILNNLKQTKQPVPPEIIQELKQPVTYGFDPYAETAPPKTLNFKDTLIDDFVDNFGKLTNPEDKIKYLKQLSPDQQRQMALKLLQFDPEAAQEIANLSKSIPGSVSETTGLAGDAAKAGGELTGGANLADDAAKALGDVTGGGLVDDAAKAGGELAEGMSGAAKGMSEGAGVAKGVAEGAGGAKGIAEGVGAAGGNVAKAEGLAAKAVQTPAFKSLLQLFQKAAPAMKWLPPVAVAIDLSAKALSGQQLDGYDFIKLVSGIALVPAVAASMAAIPVIGPAMVGLATVGAFGGADVARFMSDPRKGLDLFGMNVAVDQKNYDKIIDQSIQNAKMASGLRKTIKKAEREKLYQVIKLSYVLQQIAVNEMIDRAIRTAQSNQIKSNKIFKAAQAQASNYSQYFEPFMKIEASSLASIASSIKINVEGLSKVLNQLPAPTNPEADKATFENWVDAQIRGAQTYKANAGTTFSGFGIGEARKNEVLTIANSLNMISMIRKQFYAKLAQGGQQPRNPQPQQSQSGQNYFQIAGINPASYTGTAQQNEALRKAINPSAPDFDTAFRGKFNKAPGAWNSPDRLNALKGVA